MKGERGALLFLCVFFCFCFVLFLSTHVVVHIYTTLYFCV